MEKNLKSVISSDVEIVGYNPLDNTESNESIITCDNENYIIVKLTHDKNVNKALNKAVLRLYTVTCNGSFKVCSLVDPYNGSGPITFGNEISYGKIGSITENGVVINYIEFDLSSALYDSRLEESLVILKDLDGSSMNVYSTNSDVYLPTVTYEEFEYSILEKKYPVISDNIGGFYEYNVNLLFGRSNFYIPLLTLNNSDIPINLYLTYNNTSNNSNNIANGWMFNYNANLESIDSNTYYYLDQNGLEHIFIKTNEPDIYHDKVNTSLFLKQESNKYIIYDDKKLEIIFNLDKRLESINIAKTDTTIKHLLIQYNQDGKISSIIDDLNRICEIEYYQKLIKIKYNDLKEVNINLNNNYIESISGLVEENTKILTIEYKNNNSNGQLVKTNYIDKIISPYHEKIKFEYLNDDNGNINGVVNNISKYINNNVEYKYEITKARQQIKIKEYKYSETIYSKKYIYDLNEYGQLIRKIEKYQDEVVSCNTFSEDDFSYSSNKLYRNNSIILDFQNKDYAYKPKDIDVSDTNDVLLDTLNIGTINEITTCVFSFVYGFNKEFKKKNEGLSEIYFDLEVRSNTNITHYKLPFTSKDNINDEGIGEHFKEHIVELSPCDNVTFTGKLVYRNIKGTIIVSNLTIDTIPYNGNSSCVTSRIYINRSTSSENIDNDDSAIIPRYIDAEDWYPLTKVNLKYLLDNGYFNEIENIVMKYNDYYNTLYSYYNKDSKGCFKLFYNDGQDIIVNIKTLELQYGNNDYKTLEFLKIANITDNALGFTFKRFNFENNYKHFYLDKMVYKDNYEEYSYKKYDRYDKIEFEMDQLGNVKYYGYYQDGELDSIVSDNVFSNLQKQMVVANMVTQNEHEKVVTNVDVACIDNDETKVLTKEYVLDIPTGEIIKESYSNGLELNNEYHFIESYLKKHYTYIYGALNKNEINHINNISSQLSHNNITYNILYDDMGRTSSIKINNILYKLYSYSNSSNLRKVTITDNNDNSRAYVYDIENRLIKVLDNNVTKAWNLYSKDVVQNILSNEINSTGKNTKLRKSYDGSTITKYYYDSHDYNTNNEYLAEHEKENVYGRLTKLENPNYTFTYGYDDKNRIKTINTDVNGYSQKTIITYDDKSFMKTNLIANTLITIGSNEYSTYNNYDSLYRLSSLSLGNSDNNISREYSYCTGVSFTSSYIYEILHKKNNSIYDKETISYDNLGNISSIKYLNNLQVNYQYDKLGRIIKEINEPMNKVYEYTYDVGGNITSKKEYNIENKIIEDNSIDYNLTLLYNNIYEYDSSYKDKLIKVNNNVYIYNDNFLLSSCDKYNYTWGTNNTLSKITFKDTLRDINYTYNAYGQRVSSNTIIAPNVRKTVNYIYSGEKILQEKTHVRYIDQDPDAIKPSISESDDIITYIYDESSLIGFKYNETLYFYQKDILGNIKYILNSDLDIECKYEYDAWGNHKVYKYTTNGYTLNTSSSFIGNINPIRYKGYYYDKETSLYYLNSRYYSPKLCRFISPDSIDYLDPQSINGLNLYCYCYNNPVNYKQRPVSSGGLITDSTFSGTLGVGFVPIVGVTGGSSGIFNQTLKGSFRNGLLFGSGSITSLYADWNARAQISLRKGTVKVGLAGKFSVLNVSGQIGFGTEDLNLSLKGVGDALTVSGMAGIFIDPKKNTYFIGAEAKATALSGRVGGQLDIFGLQIEVGLSGELGSIGGRLGIGLRPTDDGKMEFYFRSGFALAVGWDFYIRIRFDELFE